MKTILQYLLILISIPCFGQFETYHLDRKLVYKMDDGSNTTYFYDQNNAQHHFYAYHNENLETDSANLGSRLNYKNQDYDIQAGIINKKYVQVNSFGPRDRSYQTGGKAYRLSEKFWEFEGYDDCKMIETRTEDGKDTRLYFFDRRDHVDYSGITNIILQLSALPEITNYAKYIQNGWVLIYGETVDLQNDFHYSFSGTLQPPEEMKTVDLLFSKKQIDHYLDDKWVNRDYQISAPYPVYCEVVAVSANVDDKTHDLIAKFLDEMCSYYDFFGRYNVEEFQNYFQDEIIKRAGIYKKTQLLNAKQISQFLEETRSNAHLNQKKFLERNE